MALKARSDGILVHHVHDEAVVYDRERRIAHRLDATAAGVWTSLDGKRSAADIADLLGLEADVVQLAIDELVDTCLVEGAPPLSVSRRAALRRLTTAAALGAMVDSFPAPLAASSRSGGYHSEDGGGLSGGGLSGGGPSGGGPRGGGPRGGGPRGGGPGPN